MSTSNREPNVTVRDIARSKSVKKKSMACLFWKKKMLEGWVKWVIFTVKKLLDCSNYSKL